MLGRIFDRAARHLGIGADQALDLKQRILALVTGRSRSSRSRAKPYDNLATALSALPQAAGRVLDASHGGWRWREVTPALVPRAVGPVVYLEESAARAGRAVQAHGDRIEIVKNVEAIRLTERFSLAYLDIRPSQVDSFAKRTAPALAALIEPGGKCVVTTSTEAAETFESTPFRVAEKLPSLRWPFDPALASYVLAPAPVRRLPQGTLSLDEAIAALDRLQRDVVFQTPEQYIANREAGITAIDGKALHFIKHDIHHDLLSCLRFARAEAAIGVKATYYAMPPHELTDRYIARADTVDALREIQSLGHAIGIHVDTVEAAEKGFADHLLPFIERLRGAGIVVRHGNTHGNTRFKGHPWFNGQLVFRENFERSPQRAAANGDGIAALAGSVSLAEVADRLGLVGWWDSQVHHRGQRLPIDHYWVGDNNGRWTAYLQRTEDGVAKIIDEAPDQSVLLKDLDRITDNTCIYLIHPQFYR